MSQMKLTTSVMVPAKVGSGKTLGQLSERQQAACHAFGAKWGLAPSAIAPHLQVFFQLDGGLCTLQEAQERSGLTLFDSTHPSLFDADQVKEDQVKGEDAKGGDR